MILSELYIKLQTTKVDKYQLIVTAFRLTEIFSSDKPPIDFLQDENYNLNISCISDNSNSLGLQLKHEENGQWKYTIEVMLVNPSVIAPEREGKCIYGPKDVYIDAKIILDKYVNELPTTRSRRL